MKSSWPTQNIKNWSTTLKKMNCLLVLTHFKSMFYFYTQWEHKKPEVFWCFREVWKWNIDLKLVKIILNNFINGYLIFFCSYPQAELYSIGLNMLWMGPEPTSFRIRDRHANHYTNNTLKFGCLSLNVGVVGSSPIPDIL